MNVMENSGLVMDLTLEGNFIGMLTIVHERDTVYTEHHLELLSMLNEPIAIALTNYLRYRKILDLQEITSENYRYLQEELHRMSADDVVGANFGLKGVMEMVDRVAQHESPVMLFGETGVGKEVIASLIHRLSNRRDKPFIGVNCGGVSESLLDSDLFGHEEGAFTGAKFHKRGRFERAQGGTIFLDEIGELTLNAQVRLLRVLQEREIERVGGTQTIKVDIRVIAATHNDLESMISEGRFREDLYFRLMVFPISIPPLRDRIIDIPALVSHFTNKKSMEMKFGPSPSLAPGQIDLLMDYPWPGNVRELENAVERALILCDGTQLSFDAIVGPKPARENPGQPLTGETSLNLDEAIASHIQKALTAAGGKLSGPGGAAELLGVHPMTLRHRMAKLGIPFGRNAKNLYSK
jgi:transcriptional regulator with GAF, ATPase, and Fis domain